jgi:hypothetical protein
VGQKRKWGRGLLIVEVSRSHTIRHKHPVVLLCTSDHLVAEAATYATTTKKKHTRISMPSVGFEFATSVIERPQTYALDRTAAGITRSLHETYPRHFPLLRSIFFIIHFNIILVHMPDIHVILQTTISLTRATCPEKYKPWRKEFISV